MEHLEYHPCSTGFLTCSRDRWGTCLAGVLTGAVPPRKGIGGAQRVPQNGRKPCRVQRQKELDCDTDGGQVQSRLVIRWYESGIAIAQRKATLRKYRLIHSKSSHRRMVWHLDVGSSHPGLSRPRVGLFALKRYASWSERRETFPIRRSAEISERSVLSNERTGMDGPRAPVGYQPTAGSRVGKG